MYKFLDFSFNVSRFFTICASSNNHIETEKVVVEYFIDEISRRFNKRLNIVCL